MRLNLIPPLEERNGMNGGERVEEEARQCTMDCGFCIVYVPSSTSQRAFNVRFSDSIDVYAHSRGRENVPDQFPSRLFFPLHSSLSHPQAHSTHDEYAIRPPRMDLSSVASGRCSPFYFAVKFSFLGFLSPTALYACRFFPVCSAFLYYDTQAVFKYRYIFLSFILFPLLCLASIRRRPIKKTDMSLSARVIFRRL